MLDAYTVRRAIPRIVIAVIALNISIYLCIAAIDIVNVVGHGIGELLTTPFTQNAQFGRDQIQSNGTNIAVGIGALLALLAGGATAIFAPAVIGGAALLAIPLIAAFVISAAMIMLAVLFTLAIRQALLIFCVVTSPVAIALSVLPGTEKYFKKWLDLFISTLMVYPIVSIIFAMSTVMTYVLIGTSDSSPDAIGLTKILSAIVVAFAPLVMIPFAFKLAGGAISAVMNAGSARTSSLSGRARQGLAKMRQDPNSLYGKAYNRNLEKRLNSGQTVGQVAAGTMGAFRKNGQGVRKGYSKASGALGTERNLARQAQLGELSANAPVMNNDDALMAGLFVMDDQGYALNAQGQRIRDHGGQKVYRNEAQMAQYLKDKANYSDEDARSTAASLTRARSTAGAKQWDTFAVTQLAGTGTAFKTVYDQDGNYVSGGQVAFNNALIDSTDGDGVMMGSQVAKGRSKFTESKRFDTISGYGTQMKAIAALRDGTDVAEVHKQVMENVVLTQGPGPLVAGRGDSVRGVAPAVLEEIVKAKGEADNAVLELSSIKKSAGPYPTKEKQAEIQKAEQKVVDTDKAFTRELASASALHDVAGQVSKENAGIFASGVLEKEIDGKSVFRMIEEKMQDPNFGAVKRALGQTYTTQIQEADRQSESAKAERVAAETARAVAATRDVTGGPSLGGPVGPLG